MDYVDVTYNSEKVRIKKFDKLHRLIILDIFKEKGVYRVKCKCDCGTILEH
jgi:hypothetical protein